MDSVDVVVLKADAGSSVNVLLSAVVVAARSRVEDVCVLADPVPASAVVGAVEVVDPDKRLLVGGEAVSRAARPISHGWAAAVRGAIGADAVPAVGGAGARG